LHGEKYIEGWGGIEVSPDKGVGGTDEAKRGGKKKSGEKSLRKGSSEADYSRHPRRRGRIAM